MSLTPAAMRLLGEMGLTLDQIIAVAEANDAPRQPEAPVKSANALRQERYRNRLRASQTVTEPQQVAQNAVPVARDVTVTQPVTQANPSPLEPPSPSPGPQTSPPYNPPSRSSLRSDLGAGELPLIPGLPMVRGSQLPAPTGAPARKKSAKPPKAPPGEFDRWYAEYPRKVSRKDGEEAFDRAWALLSETEEFPADVLWNGLQNYLRATRETPKDKIAHPATWLNKRRWTDEEHRDDQRPRTGAASGGWGDKRTDRIRRLYTPDPEDAG